MSKLPAIVIALSVAGFGPAAPAAAAAPATTTITLATFPGLDAVARAALARWHQAHPDVDVKIVSLQYTDHHDAMTTELATGSDLPDVMAIDSRYIGRFVASHGLEDLDKPPYDAGPLRAAFVPYAVAQATSSDGALDALPADTGPGTLLYRADLLERAGLVEADLTRSWASFISAGVRLRVATGARLVASSTDIVDILIRSDLPEGQGLFFDSRGKVLVDEPRFAHAFEIGRRAHLAGIDAGAATWTSDWVAGLRSGRIAGQMTGAWLAGQLQDWLAPQTAGKWRAAPLPAGIHASYGGSFYAIPRHAQHKAEAWAFVRFMTVDRQTQLDGLRRFGIFPALVAAQRDATVDQPVAFFGGETAGSLWRETAAGVPPMPADKYDAMALEAVRAEYRNVIGSGKEIHAALADAKSLIERRARR